MHDQKWTLSCSWKVFSMEIILLRCLRLEFICIGHFSIFRPGFFSSSCSWCGVWQLVSAANINVLDISTVCEMLCNWQAHSSTLETVSFSPTQPTIEKLFIHKKNIGKVFHLYLAYGFHFMMAQHTSAGISYHLHEEKNGEKWNIFRAAGSQCTAI